MLQEAKRSEIEQQDYAELDVTIQRAMEKAQAAIEKYGSLELKNQVNKSRATLKSKSSSNSNYSPSDLFPNIKNPN